MKSLYKRIVVSVLLWEAGKVLKKYRPKIVAVTGSVGKTTSKDAIYAVMNRFVSVRKSKKSFNSEIGLPLTILGCDNQGSNLFGWFSVFIEGLKLVLMPSHYPDWLVLEVGADHPGDIKKSAALAKPDIAVVTKLSKVPVHVEFFDSPEAVFAEKSELVRALDPSGAAVLNADDEDVLAFRKLTEAKAVLFGLSPAADVRAENYRVTYGDHGLPEGVSFDVLSDGASFPVVLKGTIGEAHQYHVLAALAVATVLGEDIGVASKVFRTHEPTPGRLRLVPGLRGSIIIDDTYNSSPVAAAEALRALKSIDAPRRIAVLGDMLELGKFTADAHRDIGVQAAACADVLMVVGLRSRYTAEAAAEAGMKLDDIHTFEDSVKAGKFLKDFLKEGDAVLVKGSQGVRMERAVLKAMKHPRDKEHLLVRYDKEWRKK